MHVLDRNEKFTCDKFGRQTTKRNLVRHKTRCSAGTLYCTQCPNFSTTSQVVLNYHNAEKHATPRVKNTHKCKVCFQVLPVFFALRQHKTNEHGIQIKSTEFEVNNLLEDDDADLKEDLQACQYLFVDSEFEKGKHRVSNFTMSTLDNSLINRKLDLVFKRLECAARDNLASGFVLKIVEDGSCRFFWAHENNTIVERSKLVCTPDNIANQKKDIADLCTRQRANTRWKLYKLTNLTVFAALLKD